MTATNPPVVHKAVLLRETPSPSQGPPASADRLRLAGLPLFLRAFLSAQRAGVEEIVVVGGEHPGRLLEGDRRVQVPWRWVPGDGSEPGNEVKGLLEAAGELKENFVLLFADSIFEPQALASLRALPLGGRAVRAAVLPETKDGIAGPSLYLCAPAFIRLLEEASAGEKIPEQIDAFVAQLRAQGQADTVEVSGRVWQRTTDRERLRGIQRELAHVSLKKADGFFARFNKMVLAEPLIRFFLRTPATPNFITGLGLVLAVGAGVVIAHGGYWWAVVGALLAFLSSLMDHCDGMVARLKFQESQFGVWFESAVDFISQLCVLTGLAIGLYRETGFAFHLVTGGLFAFGVLASFITTSRQRQLASADNPGDYVNRIHTKLEQRRRNIFYWFAYKCFWGTRRSSIPYYVVIFCLLDLRVLLLGLATLGANLVWLLTLYNNRLFRVPRGTSPAQL